MNEFTFGIVVGLVIASAIFAVWASGYDAGKKAR